MKIEKMLNITQASKLLGVAPSTLRRWEDEGRLIPDERTKGNQRRYKLSSLRPFAILPKDNKSEVVKHIINVIISLNIEKDVIDGLKDVSTQD